MNIRDTIAAALLLALPTTTARAAEIIVIKASSMRYASHLPNRDGQRKCAVGQPAGMSMAAWLALRQIHIHGPIDVFDSVRLKQALAQIKIDRSVRAVTITICSPGGVYFEAPRMIKVIRDYARRTGVKIITAAVERGAWSAAAMVWLAGDCLQIDQDCSAVGFHAAYDRRDKSKVAVLLPQIKGLIKQHLGRMAPGAFEWSRATKRVRKIDRDPQFLAKSISDYIEIVFDAKGAGAFLVIKSDFSVDLWEQKKYAAHSAKWPGEYTAMLTAMFDAGIRPTTKAPAKPGSLTIGKKTIHRGNYDFWYGNDRGAFAAAMAAFPKVVPGQRFVARYLASPTALRLPADRLKYVLITPHVLMDWKAPRLAQPSRDYGEYYFWQQTEAPRRPGSKAPPRPLNLKWWLARPLRQVPSYSVTIPDRVKQARSRAAAAATANRVRIAQLERDLRASLVAVSGSLPGLNYTSIQKNGQRLKYSFSGTVDRAGRTLTIRSGRVGQQSTIVFAPLHPKSSRSAVTFMNYFGSPMVNQSHFVGTGASRRHSPRTYLFLVGAKSLVGAHRKVKAIATAMNKAQSIANSIIELRKKTGRLPAVK